MTTGTSSDAYLNLGYHLRYLPKFLPNFRYDLHLRYYLTLGPSCGTYVSFASFRYDLRYLRYGSDAYRRFRYFRYDLEEYPGIGKPYLT